MENYKNFLEDLSALISCKSVEDTPLDNAPFGLGCKQALDTFIKIAENLGFTVINHDNYLCEIVYGEGQDYGIIGHLDVVPAGMGWETDPFVLTEKQDKFYGRGVVDNKAPTLICLYALSQLIKDGVKFNKKIRFFAGCNEESGWRDVKHFIENGGVFPEWGFSPDGDFPVVYAEKGPNPVIMEFDYNGRFSGFTGGTVVNAVCDYAEVHGPIDEKLLEKYSLSHDGDLIISKGKTAHGSMPEKGKNAILPILKYMQELGEDVTKIIECLFEDKYGITTLGNETGYATLSPDIIKQENGKIIITTDFRVPAKFTPEDFYPLFEKMGVKYSFVKKQNPHYVPENSPAVQKLLKAYNKITGENASPISQTGATFASIFKFGTAFGPEFPNQNYLIHQPNEYLLKKDIDKMYNIYYNAIKFIVED